MRRQRLMAFGAVAMALSACGTGNATSPSAAASSFPPTATPVPVELTVYAAASLKGPLDAIVLAYEGGHPGTKLTVATDSSAALRTQIEQGAPADVFLSADTANPQKLVGGDLASGQAIPFAGNLLTVIVPTDNPANILSPLDLARSGVKIVAAGDEVPITTYAAQAVANLAKQPGHPADFAARYQANVVSHEDSVKAVVAKIELGDGDAGIVYLTDAKGSTKVVPIEIPPAANVRADYAGVVMRASSHKAASQEFLAWLAGPEGEAILSDFGFLPPA
ncbi:MAG: molybdate ABC transporter substrate-binding protein [Chloroflexota bacterium]